MSIMLRRNGGVTALVPFYSPRGVLDEIDTLAEDMWDAWRPFTFDYNLAPRTELYEDKEQLVMKTELPGIDKKDLDVTLEGDRLTIRAQKKEEVKAGATNRTRERYYGRYFRCVTLPYPVNGDKVSATFENGVLELRLPKGEEVKARKIEIKAQIPEGEVNKRQRKPRQKKN